MPQDRCAAADGNGEAHSDNSNREVNGYCYYRTTLVTIIVHIYLYHDLRGHYNNKSNLPRLIFATRNRYKSHLTYDSDEIL